MSSLSLVQPTSKITSTINKQNILDQIVTAAQKILTAIEKPTSLDLIHYVASIIENVITKASQIDKMSLVIEVFQKLFPEITSEEITEIQEAVEFLLAQNMIKNIPVLKYALNLANQFFTSLLSKSKSSAS